MIMIAVCDDETNECSEIVNLINIVMNAHKKQFKIVTFNNGEKVILSNENFDIYFLDIKMRGISGIEAAKNIRKVNNKAFIIFITGYKDYVFEAFDVRAFNYILKPINQNKFEEILNLALLELDKEEKFIIVKTISRSTKLCLKDILYIEAYGRKLKIHTEFNVLEYYKKISEIEKELDSRSFFRCHKSFIVNLNYVESYDNSSIVLKNSEKIYMSKYRTGEFSKAFMYYLKGEM